MTIAVVPTVWFINQRDQTTSSAPNVAVVGLPAAGASDASITGGTAGGDGGTVVPDPMGDVGPLFLDGTPAPPEPDHVVVAYGSSDTELVGIGTATYRRDVGSANTCWYNGTAGGQLVTVVNPANGRQVQCWTVNSSAGPLDELVMHPDLFWQLAELTDAPVHVEIRQ